ncbi:hypothetical protein QVD17_28692 [Tagetes erecta]|uniref:Uncharacterized protein n=1 Tax=Tagetes erecta TaxID=13708 RepID=A0AAD8KBC2_TARER|nr:hypothetical protein QVD17_28692 [Tagetes erecta]
MSSSSSSTFISKKTPKIFKNSEYKAWTYGYPLWPSMDCKFFIWKEDVDFVLADKGNSEVLKMKNKSFEIKIANLEVEKMMLQEENKSLKLKLEMSKSVSKRYYILVLYL